MFFQMRRALHDRDWRSWLTAGLVGLMLALSGAPCVAFAAPTQASVSRPTDPCQPTKTALVAPCAQAACQIAAEPPARFVVVPPGGREISFPGAFGQPTTWRDPPPDPPPRPSMS